jgi:hypothetical protein
MGNFEDTRAILGVMAKRLNSLAGNRTSTTLSIARQFNLGPETGYPD